MSEQLLSKKCDKLHLGSPRKAVPRNKLKLNCPYELTFEPFNNCQLRVLSKVLALYLIDEIQTETFKNLQPWKIVTDKQIAR